MSLDPQKRINDIIRCCEKILRYTRGMTEDQFAQQELVVDGVLRNIEIIGEATKHLPRDLREQMPHIEWKKMTGMRDWISHGYDQVDSDVVWTVVEIKIPELLVTLRDFNNKDQI